jgi:hypothetical protein
MQSFASSLSTSARRMPASEATGPRGGRRWAVTGSLPSSVAWRKRWCPGLINLSVVVQVHPPHPFDCSQHRRAAGPYKPGRPGGLPGTAGFDTQGYNHRAARGPRHFGDRATNADRGRSTQFTGAGSCPRRRSFGAGPPKAGCECSTHSVGAILPLKHMQMCVRLVSGRQLVQIQPSAPDMPCKL